MSETRTASPDTAPTPDHSPDVDGADTGDSAPLSLETTRQDSEAKAKFETLHEKKLIIDEAIVMPRLNQVGRLLDTVQDKKDTFAKKALLLDRRATAKQSKVMRLELKLAHMDPNGFRGRRLGKKLGKTHRQLGEINSNISRIGSRIENRPKSRESIDKARQEKIELQREKLIIAKAVAVEKARRKRLENSAKWDFDPKRSMAIKEHMATWPSIHAFKYSLLEKAQQDLKARKAAGGHS